jgi:hypothetical protein
MGKIVVTTMTTMMMSMKNMTRCQGFMKKMKVEKDEVSMCQTMRRSLMIQTLDLVNNDHDHRRQPPGLLGQPKVIHCSR